VDAWLETYQAITSAVAEIETGGPFFRGHADSNWRLIPTLGRRRPTAHAKFKYSSEIVRERSVYGRFVTYAAGLLPHENSGWNNLFAMQHHGMPTRLLDWTTTFAVALYFALKQSTGEASIWILNPFRLNEQTTGRRQVFYPSDLSADYGQYYADSDDAKRMSVVALRPPRHNQRVTRQTSTFTLHNDLTRPLDEIEPGVVREIRIPAAAHEGAHQFLELAGISEFTLFPDLDGLARELIDDFF
jgi:hypothetical protein